MTSASRSRRRDGELPSATISEFDGVRYLHLGDTPWVQGAMRLRKPRSLELDYVQRMMAWMLLRDPAVLDDTRVVQLGLGAAALTRFCHGELGLRTTDLPQPNQPAALATLIGRYHSTLGLDEGQVRGAMRRAREKLSRHMR